MKSLNKLKIVFGIALLAIFSLALSSYSKKPQLKSNPVITNDVNVNITINSKTTQAEFEEIMEMLKEHNIEGSFYNIKRNDEGDITSIKIELEDLTTGSKSVSNIQSNLPINAITFGRKNKSLYITQGKSGANNFAFFGNNLSSPNFDMDSIFRHRFKFMDSLSGNMFNFNDEDGNIFMFGGDSFNIDEMMEGMEDFFTIEEDENGKKRIIIKGNRGNGMNFFFSDDDEENTWTSEAHQKFKFYDDPNTDKLIIVDGKETGFETLNELAKNDKLDTVDVLKGKTAVSIYGNKAKDGAIIATTKQ